MAANAIYPSALQAIGSQTLNLVTVGLKLRLLDEAFTYNPADDTLGDVDIMGTAVGDLTGTRSWTGGLLSTDVEVHTVTDVPDTGEVFGVLLVTAGGLLVCAWLRGADTAPIVVDADGGDLEVSFPAGELLSI